MSSKLITDREKSARAVAQAGETNADAVGEAFAKRYGGHLEKGEKAPDLALAMRLVARALRADTKAMVAADAAHEHELADDDQPRTDREKTAAALRDRLVKLRGAVSGGYGTKAERDMGFIGEIPKDPVVMVRYAGTVIKNARSIKLPAPVVDGININPKNLAQQLEALVVALEKHIEDVAREAREAQVTLSARNEATARYDEHFTVAARFFESALFMAGKPDLAARVRPSVRRPGTTESLEADDEGGGDAPGGGEPDGK